MAVIVVFKVNQNHRGTIGAGRKKGQSPVVNPWLVHLSNNFKILKQNNLS